MAPARTAMSTPTPSRFRMEPRPRMAPPGGLLIATEPLENATRFAHSASRPDTPAAHGVGVVTHRPSPGRGSRPAAAPPAGWWPPPWPPRPGRRRRARRSRWPRAARRGPRWLLVPLRAPSVPRCLRLRPGRAARPRPGHPCRAPAHPAPLRPPPGPGDRTARSGAGRARSVRRVRATRPAGAPLPRRAGPGAPGGPRRRAGSRAPGGRRRIPGSRRRAAPAPPATGRRRPARGRRDGGRAVVSWRLLGREAGGPHQAGEAPAGSEQQHAQASRPHAGDGGDLLVAVALDVRQPQDLPLARLEPGEQPAQVDPRSEEHTSELQSPVHLVCRLLLEKKKHPHTLLPTPNELRAHPVVAVMLREILSLFFFFNDTATTEIYTLSLHDALPI